MRPSVSSGYARACAARRETVDVQDDDSLYLEFYSILHNLNDS